MKLTAHVPATRKGHNIDLSLSAVDGRLEIALPAVERANSAGFTVEAADLLEGIRAVGLPPVSPGPPDSPAPPAGNQHARAQA